MAYGYSQLKKKKKEFFNFKIVTQTHQKTKAYSKTNQISFLP